MINDLQGKDLIHYNMSLNACYDSKNIVQLQEVQFASGCGFIIGMCVCMDVYLRNCVSVYTSVSVV